MVSHNFPRVPFLGSCHRDYCKSRSLCGCPIVGVTVSISGGTQGHVEELL